VTTVVLRKKTRQEEYRQRVIADGGAQESYLFDAETRQSLTALVHHMKTSRAGVVATLIRRAAARVNKRERDDG